MSDIGVKLTGDNSEYKSMLDDSVQQGVEKIGKLGEKVADKLTGMRDMSHALASALGINITKIAEGIASLVTGTTEESRAALKSLGELSTQLADENIKAMRSSLTLENQILLARQDQTRDQVKLNQARAEENKILTTTEILSIGLKDPMLAVELLYIRREQLTKSILEQEDQTKSVIKDTQELERLRTAEKQKQTEISKIILDYNRNEAEHAAKILGYAGELANARKTEVAAKEALAKAEEGSVEQGKLVLEVQKSRFAVDDLILKHKQAIAGSAEEELEFLTLSQKVAMGTATGAEELRLQVIKKQRAEREVISEMVDLENKSIAGKLTPAEEKRLKVLEAQKTKLDEALAILIKMMNLPPTPPPPVQAAIDAVYKLNEEWDNFESKINNRYGTADKDLTDRELEEKFGNLQKQYQGAQAAGDTSAFFYQQKLSEVQFEIGRRGSFRSDYALKGEKAFDDFSAFDEQTLRSYIRPEDQRLAAQAQQATIELNQRLAASGAFPLSGSQHG